MIKTIIKNWQNLGSFLLNKGNYYKIHYIRKSDKRKWRKICVPCPELKSIQRSIMAELECIPIPGYVHGFVKNRSVKTNAIIHENKPLVMSLDILNFFESTTLDMVTRTLKNHSQDDELVGLIAELSTLNNGLPQGSPLSPILANLAFLPVDELLNNLAGRNLGQYSRYADDMTISSHDRGSHDVIRYIENIINDHGYRLNEKKTRINGKGCSQVVAGLVVNEKSQPTIKYRRRIKAKLYNLANGSMNAQVCMNSLRGECNWIGTFNANFYNRYLRTNLTKLEEMVDGVLQE